MAPLVPRKARQGVPRKARQAAGFDRIAPLYRWLEYLTLGPLLERTRFHFLSRGALAHTRTALILGDGDGRFTARLLNANTHLAATAVDTSAAMLALLRRRSAAHAARLRTLHADARNFTPHNVPDLIVTHFFLDCLTQPELDALAARLARSAAPETLWLVSEFRVPAGPLRRPAALLIRALYFAFRVLTGLRVTRLPDHPRALAAAGFRRLEARSFLLGILTTELWRL